MLRRSFRRFCDVAGGTTASASASTAKAEDDKIMSLDELSPRNVVSILEKYVVGQENAKRAVAIALRNRWRRRQIDDKGLQTDIMPKNILMIGPTGVGKTEISRRMARITDAPFCKVEATKYTEVGFRGKDVESIIEDLYTTAKAKARRRLERERNGECMKMVMARLHSAYHKKGVATGSPSPFGFASPPKAAPPPEAEPVAAAEPEPAPTEEAKKPKSKKKAAAAAAAAEEPPAEDTPESTEAKPEASPAEDADATGEPTTEPLTVEQFTAAYEAGKLDDVSLMMDVFVPANTDKKSDFNLESAVEMLLSGGNPEDKKPKQRKTFTLPIKELVPLLKQEALDKLVNPAQVDAMAKKLAEEEGIVFIDEIDKVVADVKASDGDVSSLGVQQDLLPLVEGSTVTTKDGTAVNTDAILFICCGAFHSVKPSDMIAELQGRLPVRVELTALSEREFERILTEPKFNLLAQQRALLACENIDLEFQPDAVKAIAKQTAHINHVAQNIGARRLHTVMERIVEEYSFNCDKYAGTKVSITPEDVEKAVKPLVVSVDLAKYLL